MRKNENSFFLIIFQKVHLLKEHNPHPRKSRFSGTFLSPHVKKGWVFRCAKAKLVFLDYFSKSPSFKGLFFKPPNESLSNRDRFASDCLHRQHLFAVVRWRSEKPMKSVV